MLKGQILFFQHTFQLSLLVTSSFFITSRNFLTLTLKAYFWRAQIYFKLTKFYYSKQVKCPRISNVLLTRHKYQFCTYRISLPISRAIFSVFDTKVQQIFPRETGFSLQPRVWNSKTKSNCKRDDGKFSDCSALYVTWFKIAMTTTYF